MLIVIALSHTTIPRCLGPRSPKHLPVTYLYIPLARCSSVITGDIFGIFTPLMKLTYICPSISSLRRRKLSGADRFLRRTATQQRVHRSRAEKTRRSHAGEGWEYVGRRGDG